MRLKWINGLFNLTKTRLLIRLNLDWMKKTMVFRFHRIIFEEKVLIEIVERGSLYDIFGRGMVKWTKYSTFMDVFTRHAQHYFGWYTLSRIHFYNE